MHPGDVFISPQGSGSSYIKNRAVRLHICPNGV
nr:unnamed protein product [Callosobruchus chinensis]